VGRLLALRFRGRLQHRFELRIELLKPREPVLRYGVPGRPPTSPDMHTDRWNVLMAAHNTPSGNMRLGRIAVILNRHCRAAVAAVAPGGKLMDGEFLDRASPGESRPGDPHPGAEWSAADIGANPAVAEIEMLRRR